MSEQQQVPDAGPIQRAHPTRQSASGPDDRIASAEAIARWFLDDCRAVDDTLQVEMVVAQYLVRMRDTCTPQGVPVGDALTASVIADLEQRRQPLAHVLLRALAHLATGDAATRAADAVARLAEQGVGLSQRFADVATARPLGAWREHGDATEQALFAEFVHPLAGRAHSIALFVRDGVARHIGLMPSAYQLDPGDPFHPDALEPLDLPEAGELIASALTRAYGRDWERSDDYRVVIAAARARTMLA
jgi:hypothetical protein